MPELPEVQTTVDGVNQVARGLSIKDAWTDYGGKFHVGADNIKDAAYFAAFRKAVKGSTIERATRRGKNVLIHLSNGKTILIHMKMTGHVMYGKYKKLAKQDAQGEWWRPDEDKEALRDPFNRFIRFVLSLSDGKHLVLSDMRRFAKVTLLDTATMAESAHLSAHGPEPLDDGFGAKDLYDAVMKRPNGAVKAVLMDHTVVSGIGNIYSDEILWIAGIHPLERVKDVPRASWPVIWKAARETLRRGIDFGGDSMSDYRNIYGERGTFQSRHNAYRRTGERCGKKGCKGVIARMKMGGRSAHYCPVHQKRRVR